MASGVSLFLRDGLLQSYFQRDLLAGTDQLFAALTGAVARVNSGGAFIDEPAASAYARVAIPLNSLNWQLNGFGAVYNVNQVDFPDPTPGEDWGYLGGWALLDAPDSGVVLACGPLVRPMTYTSDLPPMSLPPQGIMVQLYD